MAGLVRWDRAALLTGAGFSHELGMPLVGELTKNFTEWLTPSKLRELNAGWRRHGGGYPPAAIEQATAILTDPALHNNYEAIIGELNERYLQTRGQDYHSLAAWMTDMVCAILLLRHRDNAKKLWNAARFYSGLARLAELSKPLWIFTLNHDICTELIADRHGVPWSNGFPSCRTVLPLSNVLPGAREELPFLALSRQQMSAGSFDYAEVGINLVKMHGSLDFFGWHDGTDYLVLSKELVGLARIDALARLHEDMHYEFAGQRVKVIREIAVSDLQGQMQFLRHSLLTGAHKFTGRIDQNAPMELLRFFERKLSEFKDLVVIGYGFGDGHINDIAIRWLGSDSTRRLFLVSPAISEVPPLLRTVADRVCLRPQHATAFLDAEAEIARSGREALELRLLRAIRALGCKEDGKTARKDAMKAHLQIVGERLVSLLANAGSCTSLEAAEPIGLVGNVEEILTLVVEHLERARGSHGQ